MLQRVIVTDPTEPGIGQLYGGPFIIPDYSGQRLMISDIALGLVDPVRGWRRRGFSLALVPANLFKGGEFNLYYEIYNLPRGAKYTTELVIEQIDRSTAAKIRDLIGGEGAIRLRFEGESNPAEDGIVAEPRKIGVPLRKGRYRLTVTVKDLATGQTAKATRQFAIPD